MAEKQTPTGSSPRPTWSGVLLGTIFLLGFPACWTAATPVSYLHLCRSGSSVNAEVRTCLLFFVPYRVQRVEGVYQVEDRFHAGEYSRSTGDRKSVKAEDEAFLILRSELESMEVSVSPASIEGRIESVEAFLDNETTGELNLFCVSNWKFALLAGIPISMLTVLYVVGLVLTVMRRLSPKPRQRTFDERVESTVVRSGVPQRRLLMPLRDRTAEHPEVHFKGRLL